MRGLDVRTYVHFRAPSLRIQTRIPNIHVDMLYHVKRFKLMAVQ